MKWITLDFGEQICKNIKERWPDYESNLDLAIPALLDPRFKESAFTNDEAKESAVQAVVDLMYDNSVGTVELESASDKSCGQPSTEAAPTS